MSASQPIGRYSKGKTSMTTIISCATDSIGELVSESNSQSLLQTDAEINSA